MAYDARVIIVSPSGEKAIAIKDFFTGPSTHVLKKGEILKGFLLTPKPGWVAGYEKIGLRKAMEIAIVNVCVAMAMDEKRNCSGTAVISPIYATVPKCSFVFKHANSNRVCTRKRKRGN
jgi:CO/xanthine dehydrogenase FAD-binding subunit